MGLSVQTLWVLVFRGVYDLPGEGSFRQNDPSRARSVRVRGGACACAARAQASARGYWGGRHPGATRSIVGLAMGILGASSLTRCPRHRASPGPLQSYMSQPPSAQTRIATEIILKSSLARHWARDWRALALKHKEKKETEPLAGIWEDGRTARRHIRIGLRRGVWC